MESESGVTMLNNIVDKYDQYWQHNIVPSCSPQQVFHFFAGTITYNRIMSRNPCVTREKLPRDMGQCRFVCNLSVKFTVIKEH
jgi:hypothetical protein